MKFASVRYCNTVDEVKMNSLIKRLPKKISDYYIEKKNPYTCSQTNILEAEGLEVVVPLLAEEAEENTRKWEIVLSKTLEELKEQSVEIIIPPTKGPFLNHMIRIADGKAIFALFINNAAEKVLKLQKKDKKTSEFVIIDGGNFLTKLIIDSLYPYVNYLSIYTDREQCFEEKVKEIYEDCGLTVQVFTNCKNILLKEADVIINGGCDMENYDYYFKKKSIYFDVNKNKQKLKRLMSKRNDMFFADSIELKIDNSYYTTEVFEAVEYVKSKEFRNFLCRQYDEEKAVQLRKNMEQYPLIISAFRCNGTIVMPKE